MGDLALAQWDTKQGVEINFYFMNFIVFLILSTSSNFSKTTTFLSIFLIELCQFFIKNILIFYLKALKIMVSVPNLLLAHVEMHLRGGFKYSFMH